MCDELVLIDLCIAQSDNQVNDNAHPYMSEKDKEKELERGIRWGGGGGGGVELEKAK